MAMTPAEMRAVLALLWNQEEAAYQQGLRDASSGDATTYRKPSNVDLVSKPDLEEMIVQIEVLAKKLKRRKK